MIADQIKQAISDAVRAAGYPVEFEDIELEHPAVEEHGDYATNVALKIRNPKSEIRNPREIAQSIATAFTRGGLAGVVGKVQVAGPGFINFWLSEENLIKVTREIERLGEKYGSSEIGAGKTMVVDYSAPNIAKRFGIGHLRSTIIGQAIYNLYKFSGFKTIGDNHLGDWGTQFGSILAEIQNSTLRLGSGQEVKIQNLNIDQLEKLYVDFNQKAEADQKLKDQAREWFKKLEEGDAQARELWNKCVEISMTEFNRIYELLNVKIDYAYGESFYEGLMGQVISEAKNKGIAKKSDGAWVIEIPGQKTPLLLVKSDGATTYATRDLATLKFRQKEWDPDVVIYEVGAEQGLHFIQLFAAARMLGYVKKDTELVHTRHGLYRWEHGKMRTRSGDTIKLEEILNEAVSRARKLGSQDEETARVVGIGAVKYFDLKHNVQSDIVFNWEKMFALDGDSGPYLQYTYARAKSVLRKSGETRNPEDQKSRNPDKKNGESIWSSGALDLWTSNLTPEELSVLRYLYRFPEVVEAAARQYAPNLVCSYLFELAKRFNGFYGACPILVQSAGLGVGSNFRLALTAATAQVLKNGLNLLGIDSLEKM